MTEKEIKYIDLIKELRFLMDESCGNITNYANFCAALQMKFNFWWCGFYLINDSNVLELGPFQGPVACTKIPYGKGVCGRSWELGRSIVVEDVHQFEGHIACNSESNSEIVVPLIANEKIIGVLDIDSKSFAHFDEIDQKYLEMALKLLP